ncbi:MAG: hypothetical protein J5666_09115 [Bacilli bacterium]|nr:hypothetical protein [Bacilli bacterium]
MNLFLYIATIILVIIYLASAGVYLFINIFTRRADVTVRNKTLETILLISMVFILISAFFTGLLSNGEDIEGAIKASSNLYMFISISMLISMFLALVALIFRSASKADGVPLTSVKIVIKYSLIALVISVLFAWLLG